MTRDADCGPAYFRQHLQPLLNCAWLERAYRQRIDRSAFVMSRQYLIGNAGIGIVRGAVRTLSKTQ
jgi:hypothetical protein